MYSDFDSSYEDTFLFMLLLYRLSMVFLICFPEPRFQVKLLNANQHVKANFVELNSFRAAKHEPNLKV